MNEWKKVKLKEVLKEINERNKDEKVKKVLSVTNSKGFVNQEEYFEGTVHSANISNYKIVRKNQFAFNPSRVNVGSIDILKNYEEGALSPMYVVFEVDTTKLLPEYFKYYFQTNRFYENVKNNTQGSVRNSLSFKALADFDYLLPSIEEQEKIVKILKNIDSIIKKYANLLEEKDKFIKSQFLEMFGNPFENEKNWAVQKMGECCSFKSGNSLPTEVENEGGEILYIKVADMNLNENSKYINNSTHKVSKDTAKNGIFPIGTTIFPKRGGAIGTNKKRLIINEICADLNVIGVIPGEKINPEYLYTYFIMLDLLDIANGSTILQINNKDLDPLLLPIPPMELQNKFEKIVKQIDKQKNLLEQQKQNYENLKKGLMQKLLTGKVRVKI